MHEKVIRSMDGVYVTQRLPQVRQATGSQFESHGLVMPQGSISANSPYTEKGGQ